MAWEAEKEAEPYRDLCRDFANLLETHENRLKVHRVDAVGAKVETQRGEGEMSPQFETQRHERRRSS